MDLYQFRKIYSDFRLAESRAKADQYKAWDYSSQHMNMRVPFDKRQYDPMKDEAEELYHKVDKFVQLPKPPVHLSKLIPTVTGGINSRLAGVDFRPTDTKFASYGELFNHIPMVPDIQNLIKQMLNPLQIEIFIESLNSINTNEKSPGLLLSTMMVDFIRKMTSSLISTSDALKNNDRRVLLDGLGNLEKLQLDPLYRTVPSKAAELLARLTDMVYQTSNAKDDNFIKEDFYVEPSADVELTTDVRLNAAKAADDLNTQNIINAGNVTRSQAVLDTKPRETETGLDSITGQDYSRSNSLLIGIYSDMLEQVTTTETPMPVLKSVARSSDKASNVKTINTDTKSKIDEKKPSLIELLQNVSDKLDKKDGDEGDDDTPAAPTAPTAPTEPTAPTAPTAPTIPQVPEATPQGPTAIVPQNATMVPTQPTPAETVAPPIAPTVTPPPPPPGVPPPPPPPPTAQPTQDLVDLIMLPWKEQKPVIFNLPETMLNESKLFQQYSYPAAEPKGIFYVDRGTDRINLIKALKNISQPFGNDPGLDVSVDLIFTRKGLGSKSPLKKEVENELDRLLSRQRDGTTGRLIRANGKPRGRGRPKRVREEGVESESKKPRVQPSSLSSFALPAQVSSSPDILDLHKNDLVKSITVKRSPIPQFMEDLFESLSNGTWSQLKKKHGFDSFFHLAAVINDDILIEKNSNGINVAIYKPYESEEIKVPENLLGTFTLGQMVDKVKSDMGADFSSYHPFENNCQNFMFRFLKVSKALTPQIAEFVSQPIDNLVKDLPAYFPPLVKAAADAYGVVQPLLNPTE